DRSEPSGGRLFGTLPTCGGDQFLPLCLFRAARFAKVPAPLRDRSACGHCDRSPRPWLQPVLLFHAECGNEPCLSLLSRRCGDRTYCCLARAASEEKSDPPWSFTGHDP